MSRNRKSGDSAATRLAPALKALLLCAFFVTSGVGYVWYKSQVYQLGRDITKLEIRLEELTRQNKLRRDNLAALSSPVELNARVEKFNLGLAPPALSQIIRLSEAPPARQPVRSMDRTNPNPSRPRTQESGR